MEKWLSCEILNKNENTQNRGGIGDDASSVLELQLSSWAPLICWTEVEKGEKRVVEFKLQQNRLELQNSQQKTSLG
jgi:hypothetical protein